jgi:hypothetical protein
VVSKNTKDRKMKPVEIKYEEEKEDPVSEEPKTE